MANTSAIYTRIDTNLKNSAEGILSQLGISPSSAIQMFYSCFIHGLNQIGIKIDMYRQEHRFSPATPVFRRFDV